MKIIDDTLKTNGKWSRKSLTIFVTFIFILLIGGFIVISDKILNKVVNVYAIDVFNSLLIFLATLMGLAEATKKFINKEKPIEG